MKIHIHSLFIAIFFALTSTSFSTVIEPNLSNMPHQEQKTKVINLSAKQVVGDTKDPDPGTGIYSRNGNTLSYMWRYNENGSNYDFSFEMTLGTDYDEMQDYYSRISHIYHGHLKNFVVNDRYQNTLEAIANVLSDLASKFNLSKSELALSFVQAIPYDYNNHEIQRFCVETAIDQRGDCSDSTVLFAGIIREFGYGIVLLHYPNHAAVGIWIEPDFAGAKYPHNGRNYYLCETTGTGNHIGFGLNEHQHGNGDALIEDL